jgi:hypothetical protein
MAASEENSDWSLVNFAKQVFGAKSAAPEVGFDAVEPAPAEIEPAPTEDEAAPTPAETDKVVALDNEVAAREDEGADVEDPVEAIESAELAATEIEDVDPSTEAMQPTIGKQQRQSRTASELADIILDALRTDVGFPERGFVVTVYGASPWNAMLTIKPEAGPIKDARRWRERVQDIGARLRRDFDVIHEPLPPVEIPETAIEIAETPTEIAETPMEIPEVGVD